MARALWCGVLAATLAIGCGDNSKACGPGTIDQAGFCVPAVPCGFGTVVDPVTGSCIPDGSVICGAGTKLDPSTGTCTIDPSSCQPPNILIDDVCQDPTGALTIDVDEGPEPNGLGIIEASTHPAGLVALKPIGGPGVVIHGHVDPFQDANNDGQIDPDVDTFVLAVTGPTLLNVTAVGVHGIAGGFVAIASVAATDPMAPWARFGLDLSGDTSARQVFLPTAGTYLFAIADTRTLFQYSSGGPVDAAPGDADSEYFVTIDQLAIPAPTPLAVIADVATATGTIAGDVAFFSVAMDTGLTGVQVAMPATAANASTIVLNNNAFRAVATETTDGNGLPVPAQLIVGGFLAGDATTIVVDDSYNYAIDPVSYSLAITMTAGTALPTDGTVASQPELSHDPPTTDVTAMNQFYYDVTAADEVLHLNLGWNTPVDGFIVDQNFRTFSPFTFDPVNGFVGDTYQQYAGLLRHPDPGRYYLVVYDPAGLAANLAATSTIQIMAPRAIALGSQSTTLFDPDIASYPFTFDSTTSAWDVFDAHGPGTTSLAVGFYDPTTAYGRLDELVADTTNAGGGPGTHLAGDPTALFGYVFPEAGAPTGRVLVPQPTQTYFVQVSPLVLASFDLDFDGRPLTDLLTVAAGGTGVAADEEINSTAPTRYYLIRSAAANDLEITVTPASSLDTSISFVDANEVVQSTIDNVGAGVPDIADAVFAAAPTPFIAFEITGSPLTATDSNYDVSAAVTLP